MSHHSTTHHRLADTKRGIAAAVDPVDAAKVCSTATNHGLSIKMVLTTHAHKYAVACSTARPPTCMQGP